MLTLIKIICTLDYSMNFTPALGRIKIFSKFIFFFFILLTAFFLFCFFTFSPVSAQTTPTPTYLPSATVTPGSISIGSTDSNVYSWAIDAEVTEVGKNAERARQFLWWVFSHPAVHSAPVLAELWGFSRNIVYIFVILVIVSLGLGLILSSRKGRFGPVFSGIASPVIGLNLSSIFLKIAATLLYATFSYLIILGLIQLSDMTMQFFIHNVGGRDLFNIIFAGSGNIEDNYISFIGYKDTNPINQEMVHTSLFVIRITSLTYYVMGLIVILRTIILWFLMIVSPFLALLFPFVFIRNIGWIWIGVFFQWLFYGPLFALFLAGVTRIWIFGIPFPFDFSRVNQPSGQVYKTAINILYGGPAQTLSPGNTANYVDTYSEYLISLVMLWAALILPWFLLRIFRDYCCEVMASGNAVLASILDRIRQYPLPPPPTTISPTTTAGMAVELPFRSKVEEKIREVERFRIENIKQISKAHTEEITKAANISVSSLTDVSRLELNQYKREQVKRQLDKISAPEKIFSANEREKYASIRNELHRRALAGDVLANAVLSAGEKDKEAIISQVAATMVGQRPAVSQIKTTGVFAPSLPVIIPNAQVFVSTLSQPAIISSVSKQTGVAEDKIKQVLMLIPASGGFSWQIISQIAQKTNIDDEKIKDILALASSASRLTTTQVSAKAVIPPFDISLLSKPAVIDDIAQKAQVTSEKVRNVLTMVPASGMMSPAVVAKTAEKEQISEDKVKEIYALATSAVATAEKETSVKETAQKAVGIPVKIGEKTVQAQISVEEYEEVKKMWLNHYRQAPVPVSAQIKSREDWLMEEEVKMTNIINLLGSTDVRQRKAGLEQVAEILPFMLLGGFSNAEVLTYIKAKLEAEKQVREELEMKAKIKEEVEQEQREDEVSVPVAGKKKEAKKYFEETRKQEMEVPKEEQ